MKATERTLSQILHSPDQYVIPLFQRHYSWGYAEWQTLWDDLQELLDPEVLTKRHFLGSVVVVAEDHTPGLTPSYQVIDGQQRLVTLSLMLCALRDQATSEAQEDLAQEVQENYLIHKFKKKADRQRYKVYPRFRDRDVYFTLAEAESVPQGSDLANAYRWFLSTIRGLGSDATDHDLLRQLFTAVTTRLDFVMITLEKDENAYKIFSSLNAKGLPLAEADLIRNHVFMNVPFDEQEVFDKVHWRPLETHFERAGDLDGQLMTAFFRDILMSEGRYVGKNETYEAFQRTIGPRLSDPKTVAEGLLREADYYDILRSVRPHPSAALEEALQRVRELDTSTTYPLLLALLDMEWKGQISVEDLATCFQMVASFILRRYICQQSSRAYGRWFVAAVDHVGGSEPVRNLASFLKLKRWPVDEEFKEQLVKYRLYGSAYARQVLLAVELAHPHKERANLSNAQIEHVMPQTLTEQWKEMLGEDYSTDYWQWGDTLGNLTLTAYNQNLSNRPFAEKKEAFAQSNILLNRYFRDCETWTKREIETRGKLLSEMATQIWAGPPS